MVYRTTQEMDSCALCIKYLMFVMNIVFFMIGAAIVAVGLWILLDQNYMSVLFGTPLMTAAGYIVVVAGCIVLVISFFGCVGALQMNKCMLMTYFIIMLLIFVTLITGGILALVFRTQLGEHMRERMRKSLQESYGVQQENPYNRIITEAWDKAQTRLWCCSVEDRSWGSYRTSEWYAQQEGVDGATKPLVPPSCCKRDQYGDFINLEQCQKNTFGPPYLTSGENSALHFRGCYYAGREFVWEYSAALIGIGIGVGITMVLGIIFSILLYRYIED